MNQRLRDAAVAGVISLAAGLLVALPGASLLGGLSIDLLFSLRERVAPIEVANSPTVVVAIDEETYRRPPFAEMPQAMWTPQLATVLTAIQRAGAKVVGFDIVYSTSIEGQIPGYERPWLLALRDGAREGRLILGKVQHQEQPLLPHLGARRIVGEENVFSLNAVEDPDGIIRRLPLTLRRPDGSRENSFALELARRATGARLQVGEDGVRLGDYRVPDSESDAMLLRFSGGAAVAPTYSLADLHACSEAGDAEYFAKAFAGKIVLFGVVLDVEDRKLTSKRLITAGPGVPSPTRCRLPAMPGIGEGSTRDRDTVPGVYLHATAVNNLLEGVALRRATRGIEVLCAVGLALIAGLAAFQFAPAIASLLVAALGLAWVGVATYWFSRGLVLPLLAPLVAAVATFALQWAYRFVVADRDKRFLRQAFQHYLAPAVIDQLVTARRPPELGGETRELTVWFSDIQGFTKIAERLADPHKLVEFMNQYLSEMTDIVMAHGGFVDKYIGDAIVAVFGAPLADPEHARKAVASALACQARLAEIQSSFSLPPELPVLVRIGVNTGEMLVGNIGSRERKNYTVMGDAVNLASRIEGANKPYGTYLLVSDSTRAACGEAMAFREIDTVRVVGRATPLTLFEPIVEAKADRLATYAAAMADYRQSRFSEAATLFERIEREDPVAARMLARCRQFLVQPPPRDWGGVFDLESK